MSNTEEIEAIRQRYARREKLPRDRYSRLNPEVLARVHERQRVLTKLFAKQGIRSLGSLDVLEIGCGNGANLIELLLLGADPEHLVGNELLPGPLGQAHQLLPASVQLFPGEASELRFSEASFDIVYQSTVFTSILDSDLQARIAAAMWRWVRPGGGVLWYDFTFDNPSNPDVKGVPLKRIRELFPDGLINARRVTLAPPLSRRVTRIHPSLYGLFNLLPLLRTHLLCWIEKK